MTIPPDILGLTKDLLRLPFSDTSFDFKLNDIYGDELRSLLQATDWLVEVETLDIVANQRRYVAQDRMRRILAVFYQSRHLGKVTGMSLDLLRRNWQAQGLATPDAPGTPEEWWQDEVPDINVTPQVFFIHPAPVADVLGGLVLYEVCSPVDENPTVQWIRPLLTYVTIAAFREGGHAARDAANGAFFRTLSELWKDAIDRRVPR